MDDTEISSVDKLAELKFWQDVSSVVLPTELIFVRNTVWERVSMRFLSIG